MREPARRCPAHTAQGQPCAACVPAAPASVLCSFQSARSLLKMPLHLCAQPGLAAATRSSPLPQRRRALARRTCCQAQRQRGAGGSRKPDSGQEQEEAAAVRRRLARRPLALTQHSRERMEARWACDMCVCSGGPAVCECEAPLRPLNAVGIAHARRHVSLGDVERVLLQGALNRRLSKFGGRPSSVFVFEAALEPAAAAAGAGVEAAAPGAAAAAAADDAAAVAGAPAAAAARRLRVPFAANEDATVVLTVVDLDLDR